MRLRTAHRILISAGIALGAVLLLHGLARYLRERDGSALATGLGGALVAVALALYLRWFLRKTPPP